MSAHLESEQEGDTLGGISDGPGRRLRVARQAQGFEIDHVASSLHLSAPFIQYLEADDYGALPGPVFVMGYIRKYARFVGLDPEPLLAAYRASTPQGEPVRFLVTPRAAGQTGAGRVIARIVGVGVLVLLAALSYVWWQGQRPATGEETVAHDTEQQTDASALSEPTAEPQSAAAVDRGDGEDAELMALRSGTQPPDPKPLTQPATPEPPPAPTAPERQQPIAAIATEEAAAENDQVTSATTGAPDGAQDTEVPVAAAAEIVMSFEGPCWVDVRDSERKYQLFGEMKAGDRHVLEGEPPYSVILGNAAAVKLTVGGAPFDLSARSRGNVARFTLDPDGSP